MTADVTTITYTDAKFTSTEQYQTEAERDAAAAEKEKELEMPEGKQATVTITEKTDYTYTGNGTYIPTFTLYDIKELLSLENQSLLQFPGRNPSARRYLRACSDKGILMSLR